MFLMASKHGTLQLKVKSVGRQNSVKASYLT